MKNLLTLFLLICSSLTFAQEKIIVEYEFYNVFDLSKETNPKVLEMFKNSNDQRHYYELVTADSESHYKKIERINNSQKLSGATISFGGSGSHYYKNLAENVSLAFNDFNGTKLIIKNPIKEMQWIVQKDKSTFLGYDIKKATFKDGNQAYIAWYTPKISIKNGPDQYGGLPGLILKLEIIETSSDGSESKQIYQATNIKLDDKVKIEKPTKGKVVSKEEFQKIIKEQSKKFQEMYGNKVETKID